MHGRIWFGCRQIFILFRSVLPFFINTVFIALSTFVGVRMLRFKQKTFVNTQQLKKVKKYIIAITIITMLPATYMTIQIIRTSVRDSNTQQFIKNELTFKGTQILSHSRNDDKKTIRVVAIGKSIEKNAIDKANLKLENYHLSGYRLNVIQGYQSDSLLLLEGQTMAQASKATQQQLIEQTAQLNTVSRQLQEYTAYENLGKEISQEVKAICPKVRRISLSQVSEARTDTSTTLRYTIAVVGCNNPLSGAERTQLQRWLKARSKADSLRLITTQ